MADEPTQPAGVPVVIALAYTPDGDQDHMRIGRVEAHPRAQARRMVESGQARWPDDPRNIDDRWPIENEQAVASDDEPAGEVDDVDPGPKPLTSMSKTELRAASPAASRMPDSATRLELLAAAGQEASQPPSAPSGQQAGE